MERSGRNYLYTNIDLRLDWDDQLEGWAGYYEKLAEAEALLHFGQAHLRNMEVKLHLTCLLDEAQCKTELRQVTKRANLQEANIPEIQESK